MTALHIAALSWNEEAIKALLDHRGGVEAAQMVSKTDREGRLPLHWALAGIASNHADIVDSDKIASRMEGTVKMLLDINPETVYAHDQHGATVFHYVAKNNTGHGANVEAIKLLVQANHVPDTLNA